MRARTLTSTEKKCPSCGSLNVHQVPGGVDATFAPHADLAGCGKTRHGMPSPHESSTTMRVTPREEARMRGDDEQQASVWSYIPLEQRVPAEHLSRVTQFPPLRGIENSPPRVRWWPRPA